MQFGGDIKYNGVNGKDFEVHKVLAYAEQVDRHIGTLTVRETLEYARKFEMGTGPIWDTNQLLPDTSLTYINKLDGFDGIELDTSLKGRNISTVFLVVLRLRLG